MHKNVTTPSSQISLIRSWYAGQPVRSDGDLIGRSEAMRALRYLIHRFAPYDLPLLVEGEESTGKRLVAEVIHSLSPYRDGPFMSIDCAALPPLMLAVELFGCARGLHVELPHGLPGKLELAHGGTLLIEHLEQMPRWIQGRLHQSLKTMAVERVGGMGPRQVQVRVIASTSDCLSLTASGRGHQGLIDDLHGGIPLKVPPLRERAGDIELLSRHFLEQFNQECGKQVSGFAPSAMEILESYVWPGNLRELQSTVRASMARADRVIGPEHLPQHLHARPIRRMTHRESASKES